MYCFSYSFMLLDDKDSLSFGIVSKNLRPYSIELCGSVDSLDGSTCKLAIVTFRSDCEWYAKHKLLAFYFAFDFLRNSPFPDSVHLDIFVDSEDVDDVHSSPYPDDVPFPFDAKKYGK